MLRPPLTCTSCRLPLPASLINAPAPQPCPACAAVLLVTAFPAWLEERAGRTGEGLVLEDDASCFYHDQKKATIVCEHCGRFLCALCDVELNGRHLCPACIESGHKNQRLTDLEHHRLLYDGMALGLAVLPLLIWPLTILTAPATLFIAVRYRHAPGSLVRRGTRVRILLAVAIASAELVLLAAGLYLLLR